MIGQTISHYRILEKLGEGGMGEVYRAEDTTLKREVAIKVLPERFTQDTERLARFQREAQLLASLNHPNIAAIHSFEHSDEVHFLAMELVEGETLAQRLAKGPLPVEEALEVCRQIAEGLEAAHESGVIHRDRKPANVNITPEGKVKILDFGLAKALEGEIPAADISHSPTRTDGMTSTGVILGTAAYMSPEQARGKPVDKRTDIWAFGCVLLECLTGEQEFGGETISDCIAKVLQKEPDWEALPEKTPWRIRDLLRRCLQKDSHERLQHIGDARIEVSEALSEPFAVTPPGVEAPPPRSSWRQILPWALFGIMVIVAMTLALVDGDEAPETVGKVHLPISLPENVSQIALPTISPDGSQILFAGLEDAGEGSYWVRKMDSPVAKRLEGMGQGKQPFWSPDSRFIGFFADRKLKKIDSSGGPAISLADAPRGRGGTWNRQGTILFAPFGTGPIYRVLAGGGEATAITRLNQSRQERGHRNPLFLPDGRHFLYFVFAERAEDRGTYVGSLDTGEQRFLVSDFVKAYSPPGYLLFVREGTLMAQHFDVDRLEVFGEPFRIAKTGDASLFSVSENGVLTYQTARFKSQLVWRDRSGKLLETVGEPGSYGQVALSPDEKRIAVHRQDGARRSDIWLLELSTGVFSRFTFDGPGDFVWSPDGRRLAFSSLRNGRSSLFQKSLGGSEAELLFESADNNWPKTWAGDGRLVFLSVNPKIQPSVYALLVSEEGRRKPDLLLEKANIGTDCFRVSPDDKWIAYNSDESGRNEVYIATFPDFSKRIQVSGAGGCQAYWRRDGKELFYLQPDGSLMSAAVVAQSTLQTGTPKVLFQTDNPFNCFWNQYSVTGDGRKFLLNEMQEQELGPIQVILNWFEDFKPQAPTNN